MIVLASGWIILALATDLATWTLIPGTFILPALLWWVNECWCEFINDKKK
jgi:hypothetical protein